MNVSPERVKELRRKANQIRRDICVTTSKIGYSHLGGGMSMTDLVTALYYDFLNFDPKNPRNPDRDRFVLSKGHCAHVLYNIFVDKGMYTKEELWNEYNQIGGRFGMHPNYLYIPGIDASTGSLGQGMALAIGMALAGRLDKKNYRVVCLTGDGELQEGSNWEAFMCAGHYGLGNLVTIVDKNRVQAVGWTKDIMDIDPLDAKLQAFGWETITIDGHDMKQILETLHSLPASDSQTRRKPIAIIANTNKGETLPGLENTTACHLRPMPDDLLEKAMARLDEIEQEIERS